MSALALASQPVVGYAFTNSSCSSLTFANLTSSSVRFASLIPAGSNFTGDSTETSYNTVQTDLPESCRVALTVQTSGNSTARYEIWFPTTAAWNNRFLTVGNGGWAGGINYPDIVSGLKRGFATMSTDTGHNSTQNDATWTNNTAAMIDFGHRALHLSTVAAKEALSVYYTAQPSFSYYAGCSTGGRQGWSEAQKYPLDFDGVLVGAPANWMTHLPAWDIRVALEQFPTSKASNIPYTMWSVIHEAVLDQCDALDGVVDGILSDPTRCQFHPEVLACGRSGVNSSSCLNTAQISNLKRIYQPWWEANNTKIFDGIQPGGEAGFSFLFNGARPQFGIDFFRQAVVNDSTWDYSTIDAATVALADSINPGGINAYDPDLRPFQARSGKVMEYHGFQDQVIPSTASGTWYDKVLSFYQDLNKTSEVEDFYRLFMVPGMQHCSGGDGAWVTGGVSQGGVLPENNATEYSLLWSLIDWVENGTAPVSMIGTKYVDDTASLGVNFTRPFCRWPNVPIYSGDGNVTMAENWYCAEEGVY
ncbi:hypothetical protein BP6252_05575 [Coleophoma cylindrospora]|uniref:Carboxylic ester hydrolase n=1 Tax=Coleophoma cylindrospora TaxID=1849047 RepID=A0A3D8RTU4_9HELO|nr:hypothetical protein BP6252_05575 [Coleophoma cylindrospora]